MRRDKQAMLRQAFEHIGFANVKVRPLISYANTYSIIYSDTPDEVFETLNTVGLAYTAYPLANFMYVRWRVAFERWYAANIQERE